jgi:hypothetical protein
MMDVYYFHRSHDHSWQIIHFFKTPLTEQEGFSLAARRGRQSRPTTCTVDSATQVAAIKWLNGNALFWSDVSIHRVEALQLKSWRTTLWDVFPDNIRDEVTATCQATGSDHWEVMSKAMAGMASGETWVLKDIPGHVGSRYWNMEYEVLAQHRQVKLFRVNDAGVKLEQLL